MQAIILTCLAVCGEGGRRGSAYMRAYALLCLCDPACVCVCVCVCERERERERLHTIGKTNSGTRYSEQSFTVKGGGKTASSPHSQFVIHEILGWKMSGGCYWLGIKVPRDQGWHI